MLVSPRSSLLENTSGKAEKASIGCIGAIMPVVSGAETGCAPSKSFSIELITASSLSSSLFPCGKLKKRSI